MVQRSRQSWEVGQEVKVGFMKLTICEKVPTPRDGRPDAYLMTTNGRFYSFVPHCGLNRLDATEHEAARLEIRENL